LVDVIVTTLPVEVAANPVGYERAAIAVATAVGVEDVGWERVVTVVPPTTTEYAPATVPVATTVIVPATGLAGTGAPAVPSKVEPFHIVRLLNAAFTPDEAIESSTFKLVTFTFSMFEVSVKR